MTDHLDEVVYKESWNKRSGNRALFLEMQVFAVGICHDVIEALHNNHDEFPSGLDQYDSCLLRTYSCHTGQTLGQIPAQRNIWQTYGRAFLDSPV